MTSTTETPTFRFTSHQPAPVHEAACRHCNWSVSGPNITIFDWSRVHRCPA